MKYHHFLIFGFYFVLISSALAQPAPCGPNPEMTSFCETACVICDIDGFTGVNNLNNPGQVFQEFCTFSFDNIQYIAFVAGSQSLTIRVDVGNCVGGNGSLEVGFFESLDCNTFVPIADCDTDIPQFTSQTFTTTVTLTVGQHYYLVMDGSDSANCDWTFNVLQGTTEVLPLTTSGVITGPAETCPDFLVPFSTTGEVGAAIYSWTINGMLQTSFGQNTELTFPADGLYEVCVTASNVCDQAPSTCTNILVKTPGTLEINEVLCDGDCVEANGIQFCQTGVYQEIITLPNGCDSIINIDIVVLEQPQVMLDVWICSDTAFYIGSESYNMTGSYMNTILTADDCDSVVYLELLVIECEIIGISDEIPVICNGTSTGTLLFSVNQGEPPLTFTYTNIADPLITGSGSTNLLMNNEIPGIPAGVYQIYISDNFGNDVVVLQEVTEPPVLEVSLSPSDYNGFNLSCFSSNGEPGNDGTLMAEGIGGVPPYSYLWSDGQSTQEALGLLAEEYMVTITDNVGCTTSGSYTLNAPPPIDADIDFRDPTCDGFDTGEVEVIAVNGGTPDYTYSLDGNDYQSGVLYSQLLEGNYSVFIKDQNECVAIVDSNITAPDIPVVLSLEDVTIDLGADTIIRPILNLDELEEVIWTDAGTLSCGDCLDPIANPVNDTQYTMTVISKDGCTVTDSVWVTVNKLRRVFVPNAFSPNGDGINDWFTIYAGREVAAVNSFTLFDRWGAILFDKKNFPPNDFSFGWDGTYKGKELNPGVYVWMANIEFLDGVVLSYSGDIAIIE